MNMRTVGLVHSSLFVAPQLHIDDEHNNRDETHKKRAEIGACSSQHSTLDRAIFL